jgi:hypothetical protein
VSGWSFRYLDVRQMKGQSRQLETKELALNEACSHDRAGNAVCVCALTPDRSPAQATDRLRGSYCKTLAPVATGWPHR